MSAKFVSYRRVSTAEQGDSGLGLEAQDSAIERYIHSVQGKRISDYLEVESGRHCEREALKNALAHAKRSRATLVVGKLDRLSRNAAFLCTLLDAGVEVVCCDNPTVNRLTLQILAVIAESEARAISDRTKQALAALKARGVLLGSARPGHWDGREEARMRGLAKARSASAISRRKLRDAAYADLVPLVRQWREEGDALQVIADRLNSQGHTTRKGRKWGPMQVRRLLHSSPIS